MDAFSVSIADGLSEPNMPKTKALGIACVFAVFQFLMPLIGWTCVHYVVTTFQSLQVFIPWIALILLVWIGWKMIQDANEEKCVNSITLGTILLQGVATSIDALSVGFTISQYSFPNALVACLIIGIVTFMICVIGLIIGKKFGTKLSKKACYLGGIILILIGIEIFIEGVFF